MSERGSERVVVQQGIGYGTSGKLLDVYAPGSAPGPVPTVLLWHGRGPDERAVLAPLATAVAARGLTVVVPDWRSDAPDGGRSHLAESLSFVSGHAAAHGGDAERTVLAGWSLGALAGAGLLLEPGGTGSRPPTAFVGVAGRYRPDKPELGLRSPVDEVVSGAPFPVPVELVHGTGDDVVGCEESRAFHDALARTGHRVSLTETDSDHAGVVMTEYSPEHARCLPARGESALRAGHATVAAVARAAGLPPAP